MVCIEQRARLIIVGVVAISIIACGALPFFSGNFIPELKEGHYIVHMALAPGSSLTESMRIGTEISKALMKVSGVRLVAQHTGRASEIVDPAGVNISEFDVDLKPMNGQQQDVTLQQIRDTLTKFVGVSTSVNTFLTERIDETISGTTAPVVINVFGDNLDVIDKKAQEIAQLVATIRGAVNVRLDSPSGTPELDVKLKQEQLNRWGFKSVDVLNAIQSAYQGVPVAQAYQNNQIFDISVMLAPSARSNIDQIATLPLRNPDGLIIPLSELASIVQTSGRYQITHNRGQRMQTISVNVAGRPVSDVVQEAQALINRNITMPIGTYALFSGEDEARVQSQRDILAYGAIAGLGIVLLLFMALKSRRGVLLVLSNLPFALVGGVLIVALTGGNLTLGSMVGFITLFGISLRNSIMLISHYENLVYVEGMTWGIYAAVKGATERVVPILMTALVTALALLPLALSSGEAGNEIEGPMAMVILGGLITSTLLNLIVLPTLSLRYFR
ncbi:MAG: hypothetical protein NVS3B3_20830 [Aquirhabdus sp.]